MSVLPAIPTWIASTSIGRTAPHDLSAAGFAPVTPITSYGTTINIGADYAGGGFVASTSNRRYKLETDMVCNGQSAIEIRASNVLIDLNGHTIYYFNTPGPVSGSADFSKCGIWANVSASVQGNIEIVNGYLEQGAGDVTNTPSMGYGRGANAIRMDSLYGLAGKTIYYRGLHIRHRAKYAGAVNHYNVSDPTVLMEYCSLPDEGFHVWKRTNQHAHVALDSFNNQTEIRYCRISNARQCATRAKLVHHNEILVDNWWTNGCGVLLMNLSGARIYNNNIYVIGTHPQGVFVRDTTNAWVYDNWIESKFTRPGELLPDPNAEIDNVQNRASGVTFRFGDDSGFQCYNNTMIAWAEDGSVIHPVTGVPYDAEARGVFYFKYPTATLANNRFYNNLIAALNVDGTASAMALGLSGNATALSFDANRIVANHTHFWLMDIYGAGYGLTGNPVIGTGNVIERVDAHSAYRTMRHNGGPSETVTATFNANHWRGGAWPVTTSNFGSGHAITYIDEPGSVA